MAKGNIADLLHPVGEQGIAHGSEHTHSQKHQILAQVHESLDLDRFLWGGR